MPSRRSQIWIAHRYSVRLSIELPQKLGIGSELLRPTTELAYMADQNPHPAVCSADYSAHGYFLIAILTQITHVVIIRTQTHQSKPALVIRHVRRANVQEPRAVR